MVMPGPSRRLVAVIVATLAAPSLAVAQIVPIDRGTSAGAG